MSPEVHVRLQEWQRRDEQSEPALRGRVLEPRHRATAAQLGKGLMLEILELREGLRLRTTSWVGRVRLGELVVTIDPKLGQRELMALLRYAYRLRDLKLWSKTPFGSPGPLFQDLLAYQLLAETRELMSRGLVRRYVALGEELSSPRGRIDLAAVARRGETARTTLPCRHHTRSSDHHLNRLLLAGVRLAARVVEDPPLRGSLRRVASALAEEISDVPVTSAALQQGHREMNRLAAAYRPALALIRLLHDCSDPSLGDRTRTEAPGFLFNMNLFFQALVERLLRDHLPGYTIDAQQPLTGAVRWVPGANPKRSKNPAPQPDFMVQVDRRRLPLDAKYRDLWATELPTDMLYQLALYAVTQPPPCTAAIVYPADSPDAKEAELEIRMGHGGRARVALRPLHLTTLVDLLKDERAGAELRHLVHRLAFGPTEMVAA